MGDSAFDKIGFITWSVFIFLGLFKKLRNDKIVLVLLLVAILLTIYPIYEILAHVPFEGRHRSSITFFMPFIYVASYGLLRSLYKRIYRREPTYCRSSWYDPDEKRDQNALDIVVFILPILLPALLFIQAY
ncbi:MAG: hypothetical protein ACJ77K_18805 [Bacteroidia bacterium]